jgi:dinuclear metal center YbgI/SA1388 family protein
VAFAPPWLNPHRLLRTDTFRDWDGAFNGLQVQNSGRVTRIAAAVDARLATIEMAIAAGANLLLVHHGLFWSSRHPWTGRNYELIRKLIANDLAIYSSHLPLDAHRQVGNSVLLARALGLRQLTPFFEAKGQLIGYRASTRLPRNELVRRLKVATGSEPIVLKGGPAECRSIGVVTGGAGAELTEARNAGVDTFITGEGPHWTAPMADDLGLNVLYAGHYATETFGVRALAERISTRFRIPWEFLDCPTGL